MEKVLKIKHHWVGLANSSAPSLIVARALNSPMCLTPVIMLLCLLWPARIVGSLSQPWPIRGRHYVRLTNQRPGTGDWQLAIPGWKQHRHSQLTGWAWPRWPLSSVTSLRSEVSSENIFMTSIRHGTYWSDVLWIDIENVISINLWIK